MLDGSRPIRSHAATTRALRSLHSAMDAPVLYSAANRAVRSGVRLAPLPPMMTGKGCWTGFGLPGELSSEGRPRVGRVDLTLAHDRQPVVGAEDPADSELLARACDPQEVRVGVALLALQHHAQAIQVLSSHGVVVLRSELVRLEIGDIQARAEPRP